MNWIIALAVFATTYVILFTEKVDRTIITLLGAVAMVVLGEALHFFPQNEAFVSIDFDTLILVMGMMIMVSTLEKTGLIEYLAITIAKKTEGKKWILLLYLGAFTAITSAFLDNVTTMVIVAPITLSITDLLDINPVPFLISESMLSIVGGMSTLIGAPPNIIIGSASDLSFNAFLSHLAPIAVFIWLTTVLFFRLVYAEELSKTKSREASLERMDPAKTINNWRDVEKATAVLVTVISLYLIHGSLGIEPGMVAFIGASLSLVAIRPDVKEVLSNVEWNVLLFYASLFVLVGGLEAVGLLQVVAKRFGSFSITHPLLAPVTLVWIAGLLSGIVDNVPLTIAIVPIVHGLAAHGVSVHSFWWALALGAVLGGMSTPIGSSANVVAISLSEDTDNPIGFRQWVKKGVPITLINLTVASGFLYAGMSIGWM